MSSCHSCGSSRFELLSAATAGLQLNRCLACDFVYLASWEESLGDFEQLYEYYGQLSAEDIARRSSPENRARQQRMLRKIARYAPGRRLLDVGCGDGQLLETAASEGWNTVGIDLSAAAVNLCKMRGLSATQTDFFDASLDDQRFDAIIMSELIEHVPAPARFLRRAYELLEDDGLLYLTTPNFGSLARRLLGEAWSVIHPEHIGYFNRRTLRRMATREAGLREIKIEANNISPSTLVALVHRSRGESRHAGSEAHRNARTGVDQRLRRTIQGNRVLSTTKEGLNSALTLTGLGDTLVAWLQKPAG